MVFTSAILLMGRRHVGDGGASSTVLLGDAAPAVCTSCSVLELTSDCFCSSDIRSTLKAGGGGGEGDLAFGGAASTFAGGGGDWGLFLGTGSGVAGVVERVGITRAAGSSLDGGGGIIPWPGWGLLATGRDTEMSPVGSGADGAADLRLMTFGGELTPETSGAGSSAWTTVAGCSTGADGGGGGGDLALTGEDGLDGAGVGPLISTDGIDSKLSLEPAFLNG